MYWQFNDIVFPGFYESGLVESVDAEVYDVVLNAAVEHAPAAIADKVRRVLDAEGGTPPQARSTDDFGLPKPFWCAVGEVVADETPWPEVFRGVARRWGEQAAHELGLPGAAFVKLVSPREYNFGGDIIVMESPAADWREWFRQVFAPHDAWAVLERLVHERLRERPGFRPHYPDKLSQWPNDTARWEAPQTGIAIEAAIAAEGHVDAADEAFEASVGVAVGEFADGITEYLAANGAITEAVDLAMPDSHELWKAIEKHMAAE